MDILTSLYGFSLSLLILSLILLGMFLHFFVLRLSRNPQTGMRKRYKKYFQDSSILFIGLVLLFNALAVLNFAFFLQTYRIFSVGDPIAEISVEQGANEEQFILRLRHLGEAVSEEAGQEEYTFNLNGDRWTVEGHLVRFHSWLSYLGVKPVYQLSRVYNGYFNIEDEISNERQLHSLLNEDAQKWWKWIHNNWKSVPGIEMVNGSSVFQNVEPGEKYIIKVLPSGFTLELVAPTDVATNPIGYKIVVPELIQVSTSKSVNAAYSSLKIQRLTSPRNSILIDVNWIVPVDNKDYEIAKNYGIPVMPFEKDG